MEFSRQLFLLALLLRLVSCADPIYNKCSQAFADNNLLLDNINKVNLEFISMTPAKGYATSTIGDGSNTTAYGLSQCRGDIGFQACSDCIVSASQKLQEICPNTAASRIWYDFCFIRHDTSNFFGSLDISDTHVLTVGKKIAVSQDFNGALWKLLNSVKMISVYSAGSKRFGMGKISIVNGNITIYGMAQCTHDLQGIVCLQCLETMMTWLKTDCIDQVGCVVESSSCLMRYEINNFLLAEKIPIF